MANFKHTMVDLETLGTTADSVILSIGAVRFDLNSDELDDEGFYASISVESNLRAGRRMSESTLQWWLARHPEAQKVFTEPKITLEAALCNLSDWIEGGTMMWSNGADFDIPMLAHAFTQLHIDIPWKFWNSRCVRTYKGLPHADAVKLPRAGTHHNALDDAIHQAQLVQAIHREITKGKK